MANKRLPDWLWIVRVAAVATAIVAAVYLVDGARLQEAAAAKGFPIVSYIAVSWVLITTFGTVAGHVLDRLNNVVSIFPEEGWKRVFELFAGAAKAILSGIIPAGILTAIFWQLLAGGGHAITLQTVVLTIVVHIWGSLAILARREHLNSMLGFAILPLLIGGVPILIFELVRSVLRWTAAKFARVFGLTAAIA